MSLIKISGSGETILISRLKTLVRARATLQVMATVRNCPFVEYPLEPPALTVETQHGLLKAPILIDKDGCVQVPQLPGIGVEINEEMVKKYQ